MMSSLVLEGYRDRIPEIPNPSLAQYYDIIEVGQRHPEWASGQCP
jgi:hypothetical protein